MLMPKTLYIVFILVVILLSSCSSQKESILVEKKGIINFLAVSYTHLRAHETR